MKTLKIIKKQKTEQLQQVYDIAVQDTHHYILGNGVVSHNSFIPMDVIAGGGGPAYGVSTTLMIAKSQLKDGDEVVGAKLRCKTDKNRFAKEKAEVTFTIDFEGGLNLYSGLLDFCYDNKILIPTSAVPKSGDIRKVKGWKLRDVEYSRKEITPEFWEKFLKDELADILRDTFKYKSVADELAIDDEEEESDDF